MEGLLPDEDAHEYYEKNSDSKPFRIFIICVSCSSVLTTDTKAGSLLTLFDRLIRIDLNKINICGTICAHCIMRDSVRASGGKVKLREKKYYLSIKDTVFRQFTGCALAEQMCNGEHKLMCKEMDGVKCVGYLPVQMIEQHHFLKSPVMVVYDEAGQLILKEDVSFFIVSAYVGHPESAYVEYQK